MSPRLCFLSGALRIRGPAAERADGDVSEPIGEHGREAIRQAFAQHSVWIGGITNI